MRTKYISLVLLVLSFLACTPKDEKELIGGGTHYLLTVCPNKNKFAKKRHNIKSKRFYTRIYHLQCRL